MALLRTAAALPAVLALTFLLAPPSARAAFPLDSVPGGRDLLQAPPTCWDQTNTDCTTTSTTQCGGCNPDGGICYLPTYCGPCTTNNYFDGNCSQCILCAQCLTDDCSPCKLPMGSDACSYQCPHPACYDDCAPCNPAHAANPDSCYNVNGCGKCGSCYGGDYTGECADCEPCKECADCGDCAVCALADCKTWECASGICLPGGDCDKPGTDSCKLCMAVPGCGECAACKPCYGGDYTGDCEPCKECEECAYCADEDSCGGCVDFCNDDECFAPECMKSCPSYAETCDDLDTMFGPNGCAATCTDADKAAVKAMLAGDEDSPGREAVEGYCEGRGYTESTCPRTCCQWDDGQCWADKDDLSDCTADNEADWGNDSDIMSAGDKHDENLAACAVFATPTLTAAASNTTTAPAPTSAAARTFTLAAALAAALALAGLAF